MQTIILARHLFFKFLMFISIMHLIACGSASDSSDVGKQKDAAPIAKIEVVGVSTELKNASVRSGAAVTLTAQNSTGVDDPLLHYEWEQIDSSGYSVALLERTNSSIAFNSPILPADLTDGVKLTFEVTVTDSDGVSAKDQASVTVFPVADSNHFLVKPGVNDSVRIYVTAPLGSTLNASTAANIRVKPVITWQDRSEKSQELSLAESLFELQLTSGKVGEVLSDASAFVTVPIPYIDLDSVNQSFQADRRSGRLEIEKLNTANLSWQVSLETSAGQTLSVYLVDPANKTIIAPQNITSETVQGNAFIVSTGARNVNLNIEKLRQALGLESRLSAENYRQCIDPSNQARTFKSWLTQAGFDSAAANDIHTKYVNNYDLGFGRDMHIRRDENGNVYSYVANFNSLENTISNRNEFAIVAMEFSPAPIGNCGDASFENITTGKKIVKFYTFLPDKVNGGFTSGLSMNFDGRGEKFIPGSCIACHGGETNADKFNSNVAINASAADLDSSFMPWDLDAFLYSQANNKKFTDPAYASFSQANKVNAETLNQFSRETQEPAFKQQNQIALHTMTQDIHKLKRYESAIKLLRGWYSNNAEQAELNALNFGSVESPLSDIELANLQTKLQTLPTANYQGDFVLQGWQKDSASINLYEKVFDRYCRLCHMQMNDPKIDFDTYDEFIGNAHLADYVYAQGAMPMSRLTMDRFWTSFSGETKAAELLRQHLNDAKQLNLSEGITPGYPQARITQETKPELAADIFLDFNEQLVLDASESYFSDKFFWKVNANLVSQTPLLSINAGAPGIAYDVILNTKSKDFTSMPVTRRIKVNNYTPSFSGDITANVGEGGSVQINLLTSICSDLPASKNCRQYFGDIRSAEKPIFQLEQGTVNGQLTWANQTNGIISFHSTLSADRGDGQFSFRLIDSFGEMSLPILVNININSFSAPQIGGNDICQVQALTSRTLNSFPVAFGGSTCPNPILNDTAAMGLSLSLLNVSSSQAGGNVSVNNGVIFYTPPKFFVGTDSFNYTVVDNSLSQKTSTGVVTVNVLPSMTYTSLKPYFTDTCAVAGCHKPAQFAAGPNWTDFATIIPRLDDTVGSIAGKLNLTGSTTLSQILNTYLFIYPCSDDNHPGGNQLCINDSHEVAPTDASQLTPIGGNILQWVEEGARNN